MNRDEMQGKWNQYKGKIKEKWGQLTNDDLDTIDGKYDQLVGRVQERYGIAREKAQQQVDEYFAGEGIRQDEGEQRRKAS